MSETNVTPIATFTSYDDLLAASLPVGTHWILLDSSGNQLTSGLIDSSGAMSPYPTRNGVTVNFADLSENSTTGYEILSGGITAVIKESGGAAAGYLNGETVTAAGGVVGLGSAATWTVTVVGGEVTAITPVTIGDYIQRPAAGDNSPTGGSGTGLVLTVSKGVTGVTTVAGGLQCHAKRAAGSISTIAIRLAAINGGSEGWWFPGRVDLNVVFTTMTQETGSATDPENATSVSLRQSRLGALDNSLWTEAGFHAVNATQWRPYTMRENFTPGGGSAIDDPDDGDNYRISLINSAWQITDGDPFIQAQIFDLDAASGFWPLAVSADLECTTEGYTFRAADTQTVDRAFIDVVIHAGSTADDEVTITLASFAGTPV